MDQCSREYEESTRVSLKNMAEGGLDGLLGSKISLISQQDIRYEGTLFSINATESSIVLKDGKFGVILLVLM